MFKSPGVGILTAYPGGRMLKLDHGKLRFIPIQYVHAADALTRAKKAWLCGHLKVRGKSPSPLLFVTYSENSLAGKSWGHFKRKTCLYGF